MMKVFALALFALAGVALGSGGGFLVHWGYANSTVEPYGPPDWKQEYPSCGLNKQSPINIDAANAATLESLVALEINWAETEGKIRNLGSSVDIAIEDPSKNIFKDGLGKEYLLTGIHIHWHQTSATEGTEHLISGQHKAIEAHFVHFSKLYSNLTEAVESGTAGALSVIGVLFDVGTTPHDAMGTIITSRAPSLVAPDPENEIDITLDPRKLLPSNLSYYHYDGSLTTPPCAEVVSWYVLSEVQHVSQAQLDAIRTMKHDNGTWNLQTNVRPVQATNNRTVYFYDTSSATSVMALAFWVLVALVAALLH